MSLKLNKSTSLQGESVIDGVTVVTLIATITSETAGSTYISQNIINQDVYNSNKGAVRKDIAEFQDAVYEVEDNTAGGIEVGEEDEEEKVK